MAKGVPQGRVNLPQSRTKALPSASPVPGLGSLPSGDAVPAPRHSVGRAHESAGMPGVHPMAVPGMPSRQGGNQQGHGNPITSRGTSVPVTTPRGTNDGNHSEPHEQPYGGPTDPHMAPPDGQGNGGVGEVTGRYDVPPNMGGQPLVLITHPAGPNPNNPRGEVLGDMARERGAIGSGS